MKKYILHFIFLKFKINYLHSIVEKLMLELFDIEDLLEQVV